MKPNGQKTRPSNGACYQRPEDVELSLYPNRETGMTDEQIQQIHDRIEASLDRNGQILYAIMQFLRATEMMES